MWVSTNLIVTGHLLPQVIKEIFHFQAIGTIYHLMDFSGIKREFKQ